MRPVIRRLSATAASLALALTPALGGAESSFTSLGGNASAGLGFRIVIPPVMQVLENSHPQRLSVGADGTLRAQQQLVVLSNMKHGFCVTLHLVPPGVTQWQVDAGPESGVLVQNTSEGYRLCSARPGRYTLQLQHRFGGLLASDIAWPVLTDITTI